MVKFEAQHLETLAASALLVAESWNEIMNLKLRAKQLATARPVQNSDSLLWSERKTDFKKMVVDFLRMDADSPATTHRTVIFFYTFKTICRADARQALNLVSGLKKQELLE